MRKQLCMGSAAIALLVMAGWVYVAGSGSAGEASPLKGGVLKIAAAIQKGDMASADTQALALAKKVEDLGDLMELFKKRDKGGIGVGLKKGVAVPDGIEVKLIKMGRDAPSSSEVTKEAEALEHMGAVVAAMAKVTKAKPPAKVKAKEWNGWCDELAASGMKLSAAAKDHAAADLKTIAHKINDTCNACHGVYRK
jgi:hypothetical protein